MVRYRIVALFWMENYNKERQDSVSIKKNEEQSQKYTKEIIASKGQLDFYKKCYAKYGYEVKEEYRNKYHLYYTLILQRKTKLTEEQRENLRTMEEKLRMVEVIDQKKRRFFTLFFNLFIHASAFCVQGILLSWLGLYNAHPIVMLRVGIVILQGILIGGFVLKLWEWLKWSGIQKRLKQEVLEEIEAKAGVAIKERGIKETEEKYHVSILFTRGTGTTSELLYWLTGRQYTHASLGLGLQTDCFYSFNYKGFREEHPAHRKLKKEKKHSLCYQFSITKEEYKRLENLIETYKKEKGELQYSSIGAIFCVLHIYMPFRKKKTYFCSEFVAEQLRKIESLELKKAPRMYFPNNLAKALAQQKNLYRILVNEV